MESETFKMRKQFLEDFFNKDRVEFFKHGGEIFIGDFTAHNTEFNGTFMIDTEIIFEKLYIRSSPPSPFKNYCVFLKPLIYFLYSNTYKERFLEDSILFLNGLKISYHNILFNFSASLYFPFLRNNYEGFNFLNQIRIEDYTKGIYKINIKLLTCYRNISLGQYNLLRSFDIEDEEEEEPEEPEYIQNEIPIINSSKSFKSNECVICLTNPPNVLFCNCGHLCLCSECERKKLSNECPICKTENEIIKSLN